MHLRYRIVFLVAMLIIGLYSLKTRLFEQDKHPGHPATEVSSTDESERPSKSASNVKDEQDDSAGEQVQYNQQQQADDPSLVETHSKKITLTLNISGLKAQESKLYFAFFKTIDGFPKGDRSWKTEVISVNDKTVKHQVVYDNVDQLAVAVFQDLDGNGILSKGDYGIPSEPYGFSNNARGLMGPPTFRQAQIKINDAEAVLEIRLK